VFLCSIAIYSYVSGLTLELDGEPYKVLSFSIMKQARGAAKTTIKFKNLMRGTTIENTYRSGEKFETAEIARTEAQFTFKEGVRVVCRPVVYTPHVCWCMLAARFGPGCAPAIVTVRLHDDGYDEPMLPAM
jgi:Elongation factor P (EF-P) KOW-like domain